MWFFKKALFVFAFIALCISFIIINDHVAANNAVAIRELKKSNGSTFDISELYNATKKKISTTSNSRKSDFSGTDFFIIDGTVNGKDRAILSIDLEKDSLMIILGEGDKIGGSGGAEYKIEKVVASETNNEKTVGLGLSDYFKDGTLNLMLIFQNKILWGSRDDSKNDKVISITNLKDEELNPFDFTTLYDAVKTKNKNISSTTPNTANNSLSNDKGVVINGVKWATRNVAAPGTFADKPEDAGMFYQWNRKKAWAATGDVTGWDNSTPIGTVWEKANDPSPAGWRVPTGDEIKKLLDASKVGQVWTTQNGINGEKFTDKATGNSIFLPAAGDRNLNDGTLHYVGAYGCYWSNAASVTAYFLSFGNGRAGWNNGNRESGFSVRSVAE